MTPIRAQDSESTKDAQKLARVLEAVEKTSAAQILKEDPEIVTIMMETIAVYNEEGMCNSDLFWIGDAKFRGQASI